MGEIVSLYTSEPKAWTACAHVSSSSSNVSNISLSSYDLQLRLNLKQTPALGSCYVCKSIQIFSPNEGINSLSTTILGSWFAMFYTWNVKVVILALVLAHEYRARPCHPSSKALRLFPYRRTNPTFLYKNNKEWSVFLTLIFTWGYGLVSRSPAAPAFQMIFFSISSLTFKSLSTPLPPDPTQSLTSIANPTLTTEFHVWRR